MYEKIINGIDLINTYFGPVLILLYEINVYL